MLKINKINKTYPNGTQAVKDLSLELPLGKVLGLVGPNGAGKSTLLKVISGLLKADSGQVTYNGEDVTSNPQKAAKYIGLMPDPLGVYTDITAGDYLEFFARVLNIPADKKSFRIDSVVEELELKPWLSHEVETLSAGWQRRLALGRILLADMPIILLDEPAAGLDIKARKELLVVVKNLAAHNRGIIISSHILPELEDLADEFAIIGDGEWKPISNNKIFFTSTELKSGFGSQEVKIRCSDSAIAYKVLADNGENVEVKNDQLVVNLKDDEQIADYVKRLCSAKINVYEVVHYKHNLTDVVLNVLTSAKKGEKQ